MSEERVTAAALPLLGPGAVAAWPSRSRFTVVDLEFLDVSLTCPGPLRGWLRRWPSPRIPPASEGGS